MPLQTAIYAPLLDRQSLKGWTPVDQQEEDYSVKVTCNGQIILSANLKDVTARAVVQQRTDLVRPGDTMGFLGRNGHVEFRNIRIKEVPASVENNVAPPGFKALFNGKDLAGWKGLTGNPMKRRTMTKRELNAAQAKANQLMRAHWRVENGTVAYYGKGYDNLCSAQDYRDFELWVDWKIEPKADSGIYLRGTPQVQIWDKAEGSGALWNNKHHPHKPLVAADKPAGQWNRFRIVMVGEKVTVYLNDQLVVNNVTLENYWEPDKPVYSVGPIELQAHATKVCFKNIFIREIFNSRPRATDTKLPPPDIGRWARQ